VTEAQSSASAPRDQDAPIAEPAANEEALPASWRAVTELELADDAGAEAFPRWRVHDRTHLELAIEYRPDTRAPADRFEWEAYFFVPESFRLDARSYPKDEFWSDFRSYVRLAAPHTSFADLTGEPIDRLTRSLASDDVELAGRELRLFACRVRRAGIDAHGSIIERFAKDARSAARLAEDMARDAGQVVDAMRETLSSTRQRASSSATHASEGVERLETITRWVDEDVSLVIETLLADLAGALAGKSGAERGHQAVLARAIAEARYRTSAGYEVAHANEEPDRRAERLEFRRHTLKRFTSSVLWLSTEVYAPGRWAQHALYGLAAGLAMAFAIGATLYNGPTASDGQLTMWLLIGVVAYAIKDRLKAALQEVFAGFLSQHFPDRRWRLCDRERGTEIGHVDEQSGFADFSRVPAGVLEARRLTREHAIEEEARPETVVWHRKAVTLHAPRLHKADERFDALVEIFRLDLSRWLRHTDDHKARLVFANPTLQAIENVVAPRVYNIGVVYRWRRPGKASAWHRMRVVVSRKGIRRIEPIC
jgi:hypothetical protein